MKTIDYYLITVRKHQVKDYVSFESLDKLIKYIDEQIPEIKIHDYCYEAHGTYKQLHCHALIEVNPHFKYREYTKLFKDYIIHFKLITEPPITRVIDYIHKHCNNHNPEQVEQTYYTNFYNHHYGFS